MLLQDEIENVFIPWYVSVGATCKKDWNTLEYVSFECWCKGIPTFHESSWETQLREKWNSYKSNNALRADIA